MAKSPSELAVASTRADNSHSSDAAKAVYERYAQLGAQLQHKFQKELAKATGVDVSQELGELNHLKLTDNPGSNESSDDDGNHSGATDDNEQTPQGLLNEDSSSTSSDEELPPEADPDKPSSRAAPVLANGTTKTTGAKLDKAAAAPTTGKLSNGNIRKPKMSNIREQGIAAPKSKKSKPMPIGMGGRTSHFPGLPFPPFSGEALGGLAHFGHSPPGAEDDEEEGEKKTRIRASKLDFKRLDELYNKSIHDFYLAESSQSPSGKEDKWEEYTFIVRRRFDWQNKYQKTYVDIKSVEIRNVLREVFKDVSGIGLREEKPTIEPHLLFNYLPQIEESLAKAKSAAENPILISHLTLLVDYITSDYAAIAKRLYPLLVHHEITFDLLWALFLPNTLIYTVCAGSNEPRCLKLDWGEQKETMDRGRFFQLDCHYVDYDGKSFGQANAVLEIEEFRGARRIDSIGVFPLAYHEDEEEIREKLIKRGQKFGELKGMHYKFYKGLAFFKRKRGVVRLNVHGRIMVDPATFRRINANYRMSPVKEGSAAYSSNSILGNDEDSDEGGHDDEDDEGRCCGEDEDEDEINTTLTNGSKTKSPGNKSLTNLINRRGIGRKPQRGYMLTPDGKIKLIGSALMTNAEKLAAIKKAQQKEKEVETGSNKDSLIPEEMTEEELLLCSPTVLGFSFSDKLWAEFAVEHIKEIEFNPEAFDSLVLPENQKTIVRALVESHSGKEGRNIGIDDVIKGKGKGLVAVLHGRPGVGKTLTAEGISEYLKRPLYMVGAGELGTDSRTLEQQLSRILDIAHVWGAVLLLDEADVFLERRSVHDLQRNALVSIFLRLLEYFQGILFLTTNRVETFDEAFQSRIHIALRYNDLDKKAKRVIWKTFLGMVAREEVSIAEDADREQKKDKVVRTPRQLVTDAELETLSRRNLNGRQIKNVVRTSQALAASMHEDLALKHLDLVLGVTEGFEHDLKGTGQLDSMMSYA